MISRLLEIKEALDAKKIDVDSAEKIINDIKPIIDDLISIYKFEAPQRIKDTVQKVSSYAKMGCTVEKKIKQDNLNILVGTLQNYYYQNKLYKKRIQELAHKISTDMASKLVEDFKQEMENVTDK
mgnify:CR=1 FL=1